jgi:hypothetical protein
MTKNRAIASLIGSTIGLVGLLTITATATATADCPPDMHWCPSSTLVTANPAVLADLGALDTAGRV